MPSPSPKDQDVFAPVAAEVSVRACPPSQHPSAEPVRRSGWARYLVQWALLAGVYFGAAKLGLTMAFVAEQVTAVWPPTGIALAALLVLGYWNWPGIALGAFLANATANEPLGTVAGITLGNTPEALAGAPPLPRPVRLDT